MISMAYETISGNKDTEYSGRARYADRVLDRPGGLAPVLNRVYDVSDLIASRARKSRLVGYTGRPKDQDMSSYKKSGLDEPRQFNIPEIAMPAETPRFRAVSNN